MELEGLKARTKRTQANQASESGKALRHRRANGPNTSQPGANGPGKESVELEGLKARDKSPRARCGSGRVDIRQRCRGNSYDAKVLAYQIPFLRRTSPDGQSLPEGPLGDTNG